MQDLQSRLPEPASWTKEKGFWIQVPGFRLLDLGAWIQEASRNGYGSAICIRDLEPGSGPRIRIRDPDPRDLAGIFYFETTTIVMEGLRPPSPPNRYAVLHKALPWRGLPPPPFQTVAVMPNACPATESRRTGSSKRELQYP